MNLNGPFLLVGGLTTIKTGTFVAGPTITVVPPSSTSSENITVRAKAYDQYSNSATLQVTRHIGEFTITGYPVVDCKRAYSFSTQYYPGVSYSWTLPDGWEGATTSRYIHPSAGKAGTISMTATACGEQYAAYFEVTRSRIVPDGSYITGSDLLCSTGSQYGLSSVYNNDPTITWTVSNNIGTPPSTGRYVTLHATSNGPGTITATITNPSCDTDVRTKNNIWVGGPDLSNITIYYSEDITGTYPDEFCPGDVNELLARANPLIDMHLTSIYWDMISWDVLYYDDEGYVLFEIPTSFYGFQDVYYEVTNPCDVLISSETLYKGSCGGYFMIVSPNPSSGETTLIIESANKEEPFDLNEDWNLEIYDQQQNLLEKIQKIKGDKKVFNTTTWKEGNYFLRAFYKDKYILGRLVVSKL